MKKIMILSLLIIFLIIVGCSEEESSGGGKYVVWTWTSTLDKNSDEIVKNTFFTQINFLHKLNDNIDYEVCKRTHLYEEDEILRRGTLKIYDQDETLLNWRKCNIFLPHSETEEWYFKFTRNEALQNTSILWNASNIDDTLIFWDGNPEGNYYYYSKILSDFF